MNALETLAIVMVLWMGLMVMVVTYNDWED